MKMRYCDFKRIESTHYFMQAIKNPRTSSKAEDINEVKDKLKGLETATPEELGLTAKNLDIF